MAAIRKRNKKSRILKSAPLFLFLLFGMKPDSRAGDLSLNGYFKSYLFLFDPVSTGSDKPWTALSSNRFRLNLSYRPRSWVSLNAAYDLVPKIQSQALAANPLLVGQLDPFVYRVADLRTNLYPQEAADIQNFVLAQNLDRAFLALHLASADFTVGRQPISWGSARVINPTDVLAPFRFEALDTEDRIGIDAVRVRIPLGTLSEIDTGYVFGRDFEFKNSAFYGRTRFNVHKTDVALLLMGFRENVLAGLDLAGSIRGAGVWLESAYVFDNVLKEDTGPASGYFRASTGVDYSFNHTTYGFIEYHFNGAGASDPADYVQNLAGPAYTEGSVYLMGRHYLIPGISYQIHPLLTLVGQSMINVADASLYLTPQMDYNIANNVYIGAGAFFGIGKEPAGSEGALTLRSEFGSYPNFYFASFRYYF